MKSERSKKPIEDKYHSLFREIADSDLSPRVISFSDVYLNRLNEVFRFRSNLVQSLVFFYHNNFEISILAEAVIPSEANELYRLSAEDAGRIFVQTIAAYEMSKSLGLDFIDFSKFQISPDLSIKFSLALDGQEAASLTDIVGLFKQHQAFNDLDERNFKEVFLRLKRRHTLVEDYFYAYRYDDFASNILNQYPLTDLRHGANVKIKIKTENEIQKKLVRINLYQHLFSGDILFVNVDRKRHGVREALSRIVSEQWHAPDDFDDFVGLGEQIKFYLNTSSFQSIVLVVDCLETREDTQLVKYLLDSSGISNITFILLGENDDVDFDLELKDKPKNLLREYFPNDLKGEKAIATTIRKRTGSLDLKIKDLVKTRQTDELKRLLKKFIKREEFETELGTGIATILDHQKMLLADRELLELFTEILIKEGHFDMAKEVIANHREKNPVYLDLKQAHLLMLDKDYPQMSQRLTGIGKSLPDRLKDEFHYLEYVYFDKTGNQTEAGLHFKKIEGDFFAHRARLYMSDQLIYGGEFDSVEAILNQVILFFRKYGYFQEEIEARSQVAKMLREKGDSDRARRLYQNIFIRSEIKNYHLLAGNLCVDLGNLYFSQDDFVPAEYWYQKALRKFRRLKNKNGELLARSNLAEIDKIQGNWPAVEKFFKTILKYDQEKNAIEPMAVDFFNIAHLEFIRRHLSRALALVDKAISMFEQKKNFNYLIESHFLKLKIAMLMPSKDVDPGFFQLHVGILSHDQKITLRLLEFLKGNISEEKNDLIMGEVGKMKSKTRQFELLILLMERYNMPAFLERLRELSKRLSVKGRNYFYYEYYYIYFQHLRNPEETDEDQIDIFYEMFYFFLRNKRKISPKILNLKKYFDERDSVFDIFKTAELVGDSIQWRVPEDFFKSFLGEIKKNIRLNLVRLILYDEGELLFQFSNIHEYYDLTDEIMARAVSSAQHLNLKLEDIKAACRSQERAFYPYKNTKVLLWKISNSLFGVLLLGFNHDHYLHTDMLDSQGRLLKRFASLIDRFYETDYKFNKKLEFIVGESAAIRQLKKTIRKVSKVDFPILITGESGSGKELVAKGVHLLSQRSAGPFVAVNSAAIPENLLEAELFGFKKGAFTGANENRMGLIEAAHGGTLFLDEIADLPLSLQAKSLRVLQESEIRRLGENTTRQVDIRLISATNKDLKALIRQEGFRQDLYFRIQDLPVQVPPLRERREDIPQLTRYFLEKNNFPIKDEMELRRICAYFQSQEWPGNVRELESKVKRLITFYPDFEMEDLQVQPLDSSLKTQREQFERSLILRTLNESNWNKVKTAGLLKISRMALFNLIKKHNLQRSER